MDREKIIPTTTYCLGALKFVVKTSENQTLTTSDVLRNNELRVAMW